MPSAHGAGWMPAPASIASGAITLFAAL